MPNNLPIKKRFIRHLVCSQISIQPKWLFDGARSWLICVCVRILGHYNYHVMLLSEKSPHNTFGSFDESYCIPIHVFVVHSFTHLNRRMDKPQTHAQCSCFQFNKLLNRLREREKEKENSRSLTATLYTSEKSVGIFAIKNKSIHFSFFVGLLLCNRNCHLQFPQRGLHWISSSFYL